MAGESLAEFELLVMLAALRLGPREAYTVSIADDIEGRTGRSVRRANVYTTLQRLESKRLVTTALGEPRPERGGKPGTARPLALQGIESLVQLARDLLGMHHQLALGGERLLFSGLRIEADKLIERVTDIVGVGPDRGDLGLMLRPLVLGRPPGLPGGGDRASLTRESAIGIDEVAMAARVDERPVVMLAVDLDQGLPNLPQQLHAHRHIVDECPGASVRRLDAPQDQRRVLLQSVFGESTKYGVVSG